MNFHLTLPTRSTWMMESFRIPSLGKFLHKLGSRTKNSYVELMLVLVGFYEMVEANEINPDEEDIHLLKKTKRLLSLIEASTTDSNNTFLKDIRYSVSKSIETIDKTLLIVDAKKRKYAELKQGLFKASSPAVLSNINKYRQQGI